MDRLPDQGRGVRKSTDRVVEPRKLRTCRVAANRTAVGTAIKPREGIVIACRQGRRLKGEHKVARFAASAAETESS